MIGITSDGQEIEIVSIKPDEYAIKSCEFCRLEMHPHRAPDYIVNESVASFARRRFCGRKCASLSQEQPPTSKRNLDIVKMRNSGIRYKDISTRFGISTQRVRQIVICLAGRAQSSTLAPP